MALSWKGHLDFNGNDGSKYFMFELSPPGFLCDTAQGCFACGACYSDGCKIQ